MTDVKGSKARGPSAEDTPLPPNCSPELRKKILAEKDVDKKATLIQLAWDESAALNVVEPEFVSQGRKRPTKPKPTSGNNGNGTATTGGGASTRKEDRRPSRGPAPEKKSTPRNGAASGSDSRPAANKPAAVPPAPQPVAATPAASTTTTPAEVKPKVNAPAPVPSQSAWAGKPLAQKLKDKPEEEKRLAEERAKAEQAKALDDVKRAMDEDKRRKETEVKKQQEAAAAMAASVAAPSAPAPAPVSASAPAADVTSSQAPPMSYLERAKGAAEKKKAAAIQQAQAQAKGALPAAVAPAPAAPVPVTEVAAPVAETKPTVAPAPQPVAAQPVAAPSQPAFETKPAVPAAPAPAAVTAATQQPVRVPEGFGSSGPKLTFGDFGDISGSAKYNAPSASAWADDSKKTNDAANSAFISNLMAGTASASPASLVATASSVKEVESQLMSSAAAPPASQESHPVQQAPVIMPAATSAAPTASSNANVQANAPSGAQNPFNPTSYQRPSSMPMGAPMAKKAGRGQGTGVPGRGGALAPGMRHPAAFPVDHYNYYQPDHSQGGFYGQPFTEPQMYGAAAQYGYGNEMGYYQQQQQQQQQPSQASAATSAPPGLGAAPSGAAQGQSSDFSSSGQSSDVSGPTGSSLGSSQHMPQQQQGYFAQPYGGAYGMSQSHLQQGSQQQPLSAGQVGGAQQQEGSTYPTSHPSSFGGAASAYPPPTMYPPYYGSGNFYYPQFPSYQAARYSGFPPMQYGQSAPLPQDQQRQPSGTPQYYAQNLTGATPSPAVSGDSASSVRAGPPGYGGPSFASQQQQQQQQQPSEASWGSQQDNYQYRAAANYYQPSNQAGAGQDWRRQ